jgi:molecular chaperone DnaK (HSP70)
VLVLRLGVKYWPAPFLPSLAACSSRPSNAAPFTSTSIADQPAYFTEKERQSVKRSAEMAGIEVLQPINEPTAAGLAFGMNEKQGDRLVLVLDFGGGTLDASLVNYAGGEATVLATHGDKHLGGMDVDNALLNLIREQFAKEHGLDISPESHPADWFAIREEVIRQKHLLASRTEVKLVARVEGKQVVITITRQQLADLIRPLLERVKKVTLEAIQQAKVNQADIKHVLPIGGSSRLVAFQDLIKGLFGGECLLVGGVSPDMAVAEGAAIHAAKLVSAGGATLVDQALQAIPAPAIKHTDVMSHSLGVAVQDRVSEAEYCSVILERNTPIPCNASKRYGSVDDRQTRFKVMVVQGEDGQPIKDCLVVAERELEPPPRSHTEPSIGTTIGYDSSGMVKVAVRDLISGKTDDIAIDFYASK